MSTPIAILVASDGTIPADVIHSIAGAAPGIVMVELVESETRWLARDALDYDAIVLVGHGADPSQLMRLVTESVADPGRRPVVVATYSAGELVARVLEAGADDIVVITDPARSGTELGFAVQKAVARRHTTTFGADDQGTMITILGPKGGTGKTLTAANLSTALAVGGHKVLLIDLDLQFGDLGLVMGLRPDKTIYDLAVSGGTLDAEKVNAFTVEHPCGLRVMLAPLRPDQASAIMPDFLRELYAVVRESHDVVVVDTPPGFSAEVIATIDESSHVCMLSMLDAPSLKNAKLGLETLDLMGYAPDRIRLVLNRADSNVGVTHSDVVRILNRAPDVLVPSQREIVRSINVGEPIVLSKSRGEAGKSFQALADLFANEIPQRKPQVRESRGMRLLARG